jgi:hypothetical protein
MQPDKNSKAASLVISIAVLSCGFQLFSFASACFNQINFDGLSYVGIARHLHDGDIHASLNGFHSPLLSWLIAVASFLGNANYVHIGKVINIGAFLLSVALLYVLTEKLWHSRLAASLAVLMFTLGRGLLPFAVSLITPDFLFAALTLLYFMVLLRCLRNERWKDWFALGSVHGLAFLAKAFALPWLAVCTLVALGLSGQPWKRRIAQLGVAALIPVMIAVGWAAVLHSKYGVFTTGTQFKANFLQWTLRAYRDRHDTTYALLRDTAKEVDAYVVVDPMPPGSWPWKYPIHMREALPKLILAEEHNIPLVLKEMMVVATLGGLVAFVAVVAIVTPRRHQYSVEWRLAVTIAASAFSLMLAYSMLVFDGRYLFPLIPLMLAIAAPFLVPDNELNHEGWKKLSIVLVVLGTIASLVYPSSPFRLLTRDFQSSCYDAGRRLRAHPGSSVVSIGSGPFPEHGVGWEVAYTASFFGGRRILGTLDSLPDPTQVSSLTADIRKASPDAVLVWGRPDDTRYAGLIDSLLVQYPLSSKEKLVDPALGEVGMVLFIR